MAAAPQTRGAPPKLGVPSPLLILLLFLPGSRPDTTSWLPPITPPSRETTTPLSVRTSPDPGPRCGSWGGVRVYPVPPSSSGTLGSPHAIECHFEPEDANVTWLQVCPRRYPGRTWSCTWPQEVPAEGGGCQVSAGPGVSKLSFAHLRHNHSGLYFCRVRRGAAAAQSCGTFVRVEEAVPEPLLKLADATKNRILTAQGVLLLLCAAGPGLLLLFRKRWANERLLQPKKISLEEENLYEGLNLDECSMYEDISRGVQPTYQDVGTPPATDGLLEKP